jgi:protein involved in polysaccharide export with SLBB domain
MQIILTEEEVKNIIKDYIKKEYVLNVDHIAIIFAERPIMVSTSCSMPGVSNDR